MTLKLVYSQDDVYYSLDEKPPFSDCVDFLLRKSYSSKRSRCRICLHRKPSDIKQHMLICHLKECLVPIHAHLDRDELIIVEKGEIVFKTFDYTGVILSEKSISKKSGEVLVSSGTFHNLVIRSEYVIFREFTTGPFNSANTIYI